MPRIASELPPKTIPQETRPQDRTDAEKRLRRQRGRSARRRGLRNERRALAEIFPRCRADHPGAVVELRAANSAGPLDVGVICFRCNRQLWVQAKTNRWPGRAERDQLDALSTADGDAYSPRRMMAVGVEIWRYDMPDGDRDDAGRLLPATRRTAVIVPGQNPERRNAPAE